MPELAAVVLAVAVVGIPAYCLARVREARRLADAGLVPSWRPSHRSDSGGRP